MAQVEGNKRKGSTLITPRDATGGNISSRLGFLGVLLDVHEVLDSRAPALTPKSGSGKQEIPPNETTEHSFGRSHEGEGTLIPDGVAVWGRRGCSYLY
jgi:hypothetical protein